MPWRILAAVASILALAGCGQQPASPSAVDAAVLSIADTSAVPTAAVQHDQDVPFQGTVKGVTIYDPTNPKGCAAVPGQPFAITTVSEATGTASHMGLTSYYARHCQTPAGMVGDVVFTAADGDKLFATYLAHRVGTGPLVIGEYLYVSAPIEFSGGTGRFEGATGSGEMTGKILWEGFADLESPAEFQWEGRIGY